MVKTCTVTIGDWSCDRNVRSRGLCIAHYNQSYRGAPFTVPRPISRRGTGLPVGSPCPVTVGDWVCGRPIHGLNACQTHRRQTVAGEQLQIIGPPGLNKGLSAKRRAKPKPEPTAPKSDPYVPGTLPHRKAMSAPSVSREIVDIGPVEPATRAQIGATLHAAKRIGLSADDLRMFAHMLTDEPRNSMAIRDETRSHGKHAA